MSQNQRVERDTQTVSSVGSFPKLAEALTTPSQQEPGARSLSGSPTRMARTHINLCSPRYISFKLDGKHGVAKD